MPRKCGRPPKSAEPMDARQKLIDATVALIKREGADAVTVRSVVEESGLSIGTFYHHFKNKDDLLMYFVKETSFDILSVSTNLVAFCGGKEDFYQACFDYVIESGKTGVIVGTMSGYEIDPEEKKADFKISLNIGGAITGTYDKGKNKFSFSGL